MYSTHTHSLHTHILYTSSTLRSHHPYTDTSTPKKHCFTFISLALGNPSRSPRTRSTRSIRSTRSNRSNRIESTRSNRPDPIDPTRSTRSPRARPHTATVTVVVIMMCATFSTTSSFAGAPVRAATKPRSTRRCARFDATRRDATRRESSRVDAIRSNRIESIDRGRSYRISTDDGDDGDDGRVGTRGTRGMRGNRCARATRGWARCGARRVGAWTREPNARIHSCARAAGDTADGGRGTTTRREDGGREARVVSRDARVIACVRDYRD